MTNYTKMENVLIANSPVVYKKFYAPENCIVFMPHWHKRIEMLHIIKGVLEITIDDNIIHLSEDDICYIPSTLPHSGVSRSDNLEYEMLQFRENELKQIFDTNKELVSFAENYVEIDNRFKDSHISALFSHVAEYYTYDSSYRNVLFYGIIQEIYGHLALKHSNSAKSNIYANDKFSNIIKYIDKNYTQISSIADLAEKFAFEPTYFSRIFKKNMGVSANYYICCLKLEDAEKLLTDTNLSTEIISQKCGFNSASYFTKCFKKRYSVSPLQYRKSSF